MSYEQPLKYIIWIRPSHHILVQASPKESISQTKEEFELAQYKALRDEILRCLEDGYQILSFGLEPVLDVLPVPVFSRVSDRDRSPAGCNRTAQAGRQGCCAWDLDARLSWREIKFG